MLNVIVLNVILLNVIMLNVIIMENIRVIRAQVIAPEKPLDKNKQKHRLQCLQAA